MSRGIISADQLRSAVEYHRRQGSRIGEYLQQAGWVNEQQITVALALQWACPSVRPDVPPNAAVERIVPFSLQDYFQMAPVYASAAAQVVYIGFEQQVDYSLLYAIGQVLRCRTEPCIIPHSALQKIYVARSAGQGSAPEFVFQGCSDAAEMARITASYLVRFSAKELLMACCAGWVWCRLLSSHQNADLLFRTPCQQSAGPAAWVD